MGLERRRTKARAVARRQRDQPRRVAPRFDELSILRIVRGRQVDRAPAGAEIGAIAPRLEVHTRAPDAGGGSAGEDLAFAAAAEDRAQRAGHEPQEPLLLVALDHELAA